MEEAGRQVLLSARDNTASVVRQRCAGEEPPGGTWHDARSLCLSCSPRFLATMLDLHNIKPLRHHSAQLLPLPGMARMLPRCL